MSQYHRDDVLRCIETLELDLSHLDERNHKKFVAEVLFKSSYMPLDEAVVKAYEPFSNKNSPSDS